MAVHFLPSNHDSKLEVANDNINIPARPIDHLTIEMTTSLVETVYEPSLSPHVNEASCSFIDINVKVSLNSGQPSETLWTPLVSFHNLGCDMDDEGQEDLWGLWIVCRSIDLCPIWLSSIMDTTLHMDLETSSVEHKTLKDSRRLTRKEFKVLKT
ncbi:hypothetical protein FNV43_RR07331 [Rhamnella rubrinervis]|uniref:Uncharacterized protein n=1 Tax=Rhamnella rubrinervis TaxID=2594499 RepID=A0A8K0MM34_9ROSA|nr:hypothetical protein FNV43_RR07331 [Rhamnella rubrinervis]